MVKTILSVILLTLCNNLLAQDTIRREPSNHYSSKEYPTRGKLFASQVKYAREDIVYSDTQIRVEYCYYYDDERHCVGQTYTLIGDSVLQAGEETWTYQRISPGRYKVHSYQKGVWKQGIARNLIPLEKMDRFIVMLPDKSDTLWIEDYSNIDDKWRDRFIYPQNRIIGTVYDTAGVDSLPALSNGNPLPDTIKGLQFALCYGTAPRISKMSFVITADGRVADIRQEFGNVNPQYCSDPFRDAIRIISGYAPLRPAIKKGRPANMRYFVEVKMGR